MTNQLSTAIVYKFFSIEETRLVRVIPKAFAIS